VRIVSVCSYAIEHVLLALADDLGPLPQPAFTYKCPPNEKGNRQLSEGVTQTGSGTYRVAGSSAVGAVAKIWLTEMAFSTSLPKELQAVKKTTLSAMATKSA
jgi:hypothetical protein